MLHYTVVCLAVVVSPGHEVGVARQLSAVAQCLSLYLDAREAQRVFDGTTEDIQPVAHLLAKRSSSRVCACYTEAYFFLPNNRV